MDPIIPPVADPGTPPVADPGNSDPKTVPYESHRALLDEKKKAETKARELQEKLDAREREDAEKSGDLKKMIELEKKRADALEARVKANDEQEQNRRKLAAVLGALEGQVDAKFFNLIDFEKVILDDSGNANALSVKEVADAVARNYPEIIKKKGGPQLPANAPQGGAPQTATIKREAWLKLPSSEMGKWKPDQVVD